ncbi:hypothetical protein PoB_001870600 [Plakobranchus ocellatus]|uniref:Uncharacterized protein n=1 Tax=Plakobranchus ocellatus TaxID=259542 RepID=A0AAV3ZC38_9GAST|nr:hypothetical protein PoB_001870600 [Plakobranchus ocellatus]
MTVARSHLCARKRMAAAVSQLQHAPNGRAALPSCPERGRKGKRRRLSRQRRSADYCAQGCLENNALTTLKVKSLSRNELSASLASDERSLPTRDTRHMTFDLLIPQSPLLKALNTLY